VVTLPTNSRPHGRQVSFHSPALVQISHNSVKFSCTGRHTSNNSITGLT